MKLKTLGIITILFFIVALSLTVFLNQKQQHRNPNSSTATPDKTSLSILSAVNVGGLHISGNKILNSTGEAIQFHGINRSSFEYMCIDSTSGGANFDGAADQAEVNGMKSWNINSVRLVLNEDCWLGLHGLPTSGVAKYQQDVKNYVSLLTSNNISVIVNLHFNGDGNTKATEQQPMSDRAHSNDFWTSIANTFKDNSSVLFEPYNEPHDISWSCWKDGGCSVKGSRSGDGNFIVAGMQEMTNAIRATGATNIIVITGLNWGSDISQWVQFKPSDPLNQLAAGWHSYGDGLSCQNLACWNTTLKSVLNTAPILGTEIGEFDCNHTYIDQVMNFLDSVGQSYYAWAWGPYNCAKDPALITDWSGNPTQTYGQGYKNHLLQLPSNTPVPTQSQSPTPAISPLDTPTPIISGAFLPEDIDRDGCVGILDFNAWFQAMRGNPRPGTFPDINGDGSVDIVDFNLWFRAMKNLPKDKLC